MDKLKKFEEIVSLLDKDQPSTQEVAEAIEAVLGVVAQVKEMLVKEMEQMGKEMSQSHRDMVAEMERVEKDMKEMEKGCKAMSKEECRKMTEKVMTEIERVEELIPTIPDLTYLERRIEEVKKEIPKIPDLPQNLVYREELEEKIEELKEELKAIRNLPRGGGGAARRVFQPYRDDFSSLTNGVTKTFYLSRAPLQNETVMVFGTDFPTILRPTIDFTIANKTLTLTSEVPAPSTNATLICTYFS